MNYQLVDIDQAIFAVEQKLKKLQRQLEMLKVMNAMYKAVQTKGDRI